MDYINQGLKYLTNKYNVKGIGKILKEDLIFIKDEKEIPLLPWRRERRFIELKNLVNDGTLEGISTMRTCRIDKVNKSLNDLIYCELDLCEWILDSKVQSIFTVKNGDRVANIVVKLQSGVVCTIELATTLSNDVNVIDKHEIIAQRGVASDRVVDTQIPQQSIYVFTNKEKPLTYIDVDFELYNYNVEDVAIIRQSFDIMQDKSLADKLTMSAKHLKNMVKISEKSADLLSNMQVGEG